MLLYSHQSYIETLSVFLNLRDLILIGFLESRHTPDTHMPMSHSAQGQEIVSVNNHCPLSGQEGVLCIRYLLTTKFYWSAGNNQS